MSALVRDQTFWASAGFAVVLGLVVVAAARLVGRSLDAGVAMVVAALLGLWTADLASSELVGALALLALGAALTSRRSIAWQAVGAAPGAVVLLTAIPSIVPVWARVLVPCAVVVIAPLGSSLALARPRLPVVLFAISAAGVYFTVPDTEQARVVVGAGVVVALLVLDPLTRVGAAGTAAVIALLAWTAAVGGYGRPGAVVGAVACAGALTLGPALARVRSTDVEVLVLHFVMVLVAARVAGLRDDAWVAASIVGVATVVALLAVGLLGRARRSGPAASRQG